MKHYPTNLNDHNMINMDMPQRIQTLMVDSVEDLAVLVDLVAEIHSLDLKIFLISFLVEAGERLHVILMHLDKVKTYNM